MLQITRLALWYFLVALLAFGDVGGFAPSDGVTIVFDPPASLGTIPRSINNNQVVTGDFLQGDPIHGNVNHGFIRDANGTITVFDPPNCHYNGDNGGFSINDNGDVVGFFIEDPTFRFRGFVRKANGTFDVFGVDPYTDTIAMSINAGGDVTGYTLGSPIRGFLRESNGTITPFDVGSGGYTLGLSINDSGDILGTYIDSDRSSHAFVRTRAGKVFKIVTPSPLLSVSNINAQGFVAGSWLDDSTTGQSTGFLWDRLQGAVPLKIRPKMSFISLVQVNSIGEITGFFTATDPRGIPSIVRPERPSIPSTQQEFFLKTTTGKDILLFSPGEFSTEVYLGFNDLGAAAGYGFGLDGVPHGLIRIAILKPDH
jgi:hypothetical protein